MEADTISKHGRISKNLTSRANYFFCNMNVFVLVAFSVIALSSCVVCKNQIIGDVIGFSDDVNPATFDTKMCIVPYLQPKGEPVNLKTNLKVFEAAVGNLKPGTNTAAYDAMNLGLKRVKNVKKQHSGFRCPQTKYYILFFTDGKDNVSATTDKSYERYAKKIGRKVRTSMGLFNRKNSFESWALLLEGKELQADGYDQDQKEEMLRPFADARNSTRFPDGTRPPVLVDQDIKRLFDEFIEKFTQQSFSFYIPKGYSGKKIKMTLKDVSGNEVEFEGELAKKWFWLRYRLLNINTSSGFNFEIERGNRITMQATTNLKRSNRIDFEIRGLTKNGEVFVPVVEPDGYVTQHFFDRGAFRTNTEYRQSGMQIEDAYILAIIDCSESLGKKDFEEAKRLTLEAIQKIVLGK